MHSIWNNGIVISAIEQNRSKKRKQSSLMPNERSRMPRLHVCHAEKSVICEIRVFKFPREIHQITTLREIIDDAGASDAGGWPPLNKINKSIACPIVCQEAGLWKRSALLERRTAMFNLARDQGECTCISGEKKITRKILTQKEQTRRESRDRVETIYSC